MSPPNGTAETVPESDLQFGRLVVDQGLARLDQVEECLQIQRQLIDQHVSPLLRLGEIMLRAGYLTLDQVHRTVRISAGASPSRPEPPPSKDLPDSVAERIEDPANWIGKYVRVLRLGVGGMGEVWKAWDTQLHRWVALKFLIHRDPGEIARFQRESQTVAHLNHPNIAAVYETGEVPSTASWQAGRPYIVLQYIDGQTLAIFPRNDTKRIVELIAEAALAVHHAHEQGVIHRDLKPANIMVEGTPKPRKKTSRRFPGQSRMEGLRVYVTDFGLAKQTSGVTSSLSVSGMTFGTPSYMPPEQARGEHAEIGPRSDVYSLGATLYDLLAGRPPFHAPNAYDILRAVVDEEPVRLKKIIPSIDPDLETIVMKCLEKLPLRRYASALVLAEDLTRWLDGEPILANLPSILYRLKKTVLRRKAAFLVGTAAAAALAISAVLVIPSWRHSARQAELQARLAEAEKRRADAEEGKRKNLELYADLEQRLTLLKMNFYRPDYRLTEEEWEKYETLIGVIESQMRVAGESAEGRYLIGRCRDVLADAHASESAYQRALELEPDHVKTLLNLGRLKCERALYEGRSERTHPIRSLWSHRTAAEGVELVRRGRKLLLGKGSIDADLAEAYARVRGGETPDPLYSFSQMQIRWSQEPFVEEFLLVEALTRDAEGKINGATKVLEGIPSFPKAFFWRGVGYRQRGLPDEAIENFSRALTIHPRFFIAYFHRGMAYRDRGDLDQALTDLDQFLEHDPSAPTALFNRAGLRFEQGNLGGALDDCDRAIQLDPDDPVIFANRSLIHKRRGETERAILDLMQALEVAPKDWPVRQNAEQLLKQYRKEIERGES